VGVVSRSTSNLISGVEATEASLWSGSFNRRRSCKRSSKQFAKGIQMFSGDF
jgi:hypothetical protein